MHRLLDLPKTLWERDQTSTLVIFDEFQDLLVARQDLDGLLRSVIQYHGDAAAYVYAGSEPSMMRGLFDARERPLFGQADPLALERLPLDDVLADLAERFEIEGLDPGEALGELAVFADGHPQRVMLLCYLLAEQLEAGRPGTPETAALVLDEALERTQAAHQALWGQLEPEREGRAGRRRRWRGAREPRARGGAPAVSSDPPRGRRPARRPGAPRSRASGRAADRSAARRVAPTALA